MNEKTISPKGEERTPVEPPAGHYERTPIPGTDERLPERRFTVGRFIPAHEEANR